MWIDLEIIKPDTGKKYACRYHVHMRPGGGIVSGYISSLSGQFFCDICSNGLYAAKSYIEIYAYER